MTDQSNTPPEPPSDRATDARHLPVYRHEAEIIAAVRDHRVVVVEGPTGSGKTTQIPRILLHAGLTDRIIGVTQPRRIAAVSVAWRIAAELGFELGDEVGYAIRFDDRTSRDTVIKVMTDGILLQEARSDADFSAYGVLMIDEAHERTLNIDFTLGLLHRVLTRRPELRVIVSSATLQPEHFQRFFGSIPGVHDVPLVRIDARPWPVETFYRPPGSDDPADIAEAAAREVVAIHRRGDPGHILVFLSGEDMIGRTHDAIVRLQPGRNLAVLPLYGRLTREEQERVFDPFPGQRKVVLATNIAETSITIPDTRFVVDSGLAKVPRVSTNTGITTLREEGISQASADQRAGRAGRTAPGTAIRLYDRKSYEQRPRFTDEEILRLDLTEVALRLIDLGIHDVEDFPFPTAPPRSKIRAAIASLHAMRAIDDDRQLTAIGRRMVPFPLSPSLARVIVEAAERFPDVVDEVLVVCAFLSARPPYLYPQGEEGEAREAQRELAHPLGDAATAVQTYRNWRRAKDRDRFCQRYYLDGQTMAFIEKAHGQLTDIAQAHGITIRSGGDPWEINRCVAAGFADNFLLGQGRIYEGPGETSIAIHPSSVLFGERHRFVVAAEIVVSQRAYARQVSVVKPGWIAELNPELARRWQIRTRRDEDKRGAPPPEVVPDKLQLDGVAVPVAVKRGKPLVELALEQIERLRKVGPAAVPPNAAGWRARLASAKHGELMSGPLAAVLALLPHVPLPAPDQELLRDVPEGALLEADRNLHTILRYLDRLLEPMLPARGKRPGWLMLVANGGGGYWFEVYPDYKDALETTLVSLGDLMQTLPPADPVQERLEALSIALDEKVDAVREALANAKRRPNA